MGDTAPELAIIIPHRDDHARLARCLEALTARPEALEGVEIVVADNGSVPPPEIGAAPVRLVHAPRPGAAHARNAGVAATRAPRLAFLDADCVPQPGWLAHARALPVEGAVVGGRIDLFDETPPPRSGAEAFERVFAFRQRAYIERHGFSVTANLLTTRAVFEMTGPFRAGLSEDKDWCHRAVAAGARLRYDDALAVAHPARSDWPALAGKWRRLTQEGFGLTDGSARARLGWGLRALAMPFSVAAHAPRVLRHPGLAAGERGRALATLARLRLARCGWMLAQALHGRPTGRGRPS
ncbi:glycosyltransferase family 2 protein [Jannaschia seohaensis]|uniref:GT2 family glycosyltransferase n=1 Tax=Jannaschia seohaensis TaxID=475081 RepID=A0A2Y9C317_9RHOB|nr:glycosyltransferase [Jannaschia seohaensis]PWJ12894.1 GT2 family glycosyltransferase [Jannaschia seohaensis]SSA50702.1 Glycosyltransferase, GT2 family [Jannaschia seohaensis]